MSGKVSTNTQQAVINLDPRTKLYTLMVFSLVMAPSSESELDTILKIVFAGLAFLMLINIRRPGLAAVYAAAYCAAYGANGLLAYISGMSLLGIIIRLLVEVVLRMMPTLFIAMSFLQTTKVSEFVAAMEKMHITRKITIPFAVIFRFFPTVADEYHSIQDAMKMRGIGISKGPIAMLEYRLVPLIASVVQIGDELSAAAVARGLGVDTERSNYCKIKIKGLDILLMVLLTAALILYYLF